MSWGRVYAEQIGAIWNASRTGATEELAAVAAAAHAAQVEHKKAESALKRHRRIDC